MEQQDVRHEQFTQIVHGTLHVFRRYISERMLDVFDVVRLHALWALITRITQSTQRRKATGNVK